MTDKQQQLIETFKGLIQQYGIELHIDPKEYSIKSPVALDVEHDENGGMVGIGIYDGKKAYYFTRITSKLKAALEQ